MSFDTAKIYELLPAVHRTRDAEQGYALRELIDIIAGQVAVLEDNLEQLYDNHFVETADPWALAYLGELLGIQGLPASNMARSPRAEVGHTISYRRRKGTAPVLELLARDITGFPARAVEFFERLAATQHLNHLRPTCRAFTSLRDSRELERFDSPFEYAMRTIEVRRIEPGRGKWNIANVGLFLWRLRAYSRTASPLVLVEELFAGDPSSGKRFRLNPFGFDSQLFLRPITEIDVAQLAGPMNVPLPMSRRMLAKDAATFAPEGLLYGPGLSLSVEECVDGVYQPIPSDRVIVCDLSDARDEANNPIWNHEKKPSDDQLAIDPVLGRLVFGTAPEDSDHPPRVTFHYGFGFDLGGGEYGRASSFDANQQVVAQVPKSTSSAVPSFDNLGDAISHADGSGVIEIYSSGRYVESFPDVVATGESIEIRAADERCPALLVKPSASGQPWTLSGDDDASVSLNGLWIAGEILASGELGRFNLRHCTITPGWTTNAEGMVVTAPGNFLQIASRGTDVVIENSILPSLRVGNDNVRLLLRNCIVDAGTESGFALSNLTGDGPAGSWRLENCTIIGRVAVDMLELASNCIMLGESISVRRRQEGCIRFSWLPDSPENRTPRRYRCLPEGSGKNAGVRPQFVSLRFGDPGYGQLSRRCPKAILTGADDGGEIGAFHDLFLPQREAHLRARLAEYLRFGLETGVFYES